MFGIKRLQKQIKNIKHDVDLFIELINSMDQPWKIRFDYVAEKRCIEYESIVKNSMDYGLEINRLKLQVENLSDYTNSDVKRYTCSNGIVIYYYFDKESGEYIHRKSTSMTWEPVEEYMLDMWKTIYGKNS